jgi:hypothetical protein
MRVIGPPSHPIRAPKGEDLSGFSGEAWFLPPLHVAGYVLIKHWLFRRLRHLRKNKWAQLFEIGRVQGGLFGSPFFGWSASEAKHEWRMLP